MKLGVYHPVYSGLNPKSKKGSETELLVVNLFLRAIIN
jgi:hypothetical protein